MVCAEVPIGAGYREGSGEDVAGGNVAGTQGGGSCRYRGILGLRRSPAVITDRMGNNRRIAPFYRLAGADMDCLGLEAREAHIDDGGRIRRGWAMSPTAEAAAGLARYRQYSEAIR